MAFARHVRDTGGRVRGTRLMTPGDDEDVDDDDEEEEEGEAAVPLLGGAVGDLE